MGKVKGLLMSDVADKHGVCVIARSFGCIDELLLQPWQACAVDGLKGGVLFSIRMAVWSWRVAKEG